MSRRLRQQGFTLIELIVVLVIMVLGFSAIAINISSGNASTEVTAAAREIVSALRYARGQALISHQEITVTFDLAENSYTLSNRSEIYPISKAIDITVVTAQSELTGQEQGNIRFFPDGSCTGGRVTVERDNTVRQIDINWLTGQVEIENK
ncbi:MAG: GspH/FimT family pseudopilin [Methylococcaceae bacterium]